MDTRENAELIVWSQVNKYLKLDEFNGKVFKYSIHFYAMGFNDDLLKACESPAAPLSTLQAVEYDSSGEKVQYNLDERALSKVCPPPKEALAGLALSSIKTPVRLVKVHLRLRL